MSVSRIQRPLLFFVAACLGGIIIGVAIRPAIPTLSGASAEPSEDSLTLPESSTAPSPATILTKRSKEPSGVLKELATLPASQRILWLATQAESATPDQMARLVALAKKENHMDIELARALAAHWADLDPAHMMETLAANGEDDYRLWKILCIQWAQSDPETAAAQFASANHSEGGDQWNALLWKYLMRYSPEVGIKASSQLVQGRQGTELSRRWASRDPKKAAELVLEHMSEKHDRSAAMGVIGRTWGTSDPEGALEYAKSIPSAQARLELAEMVLRSWAMSDPEGATDHMASVDEPIERARLGKGIAAGLANSDPQAALAFAQANLHSSTRAEAIGDIVSAVAERDVSTAAELVANMDPGRAMNHAVSELLSEWANTDPSKNGDMFTWLGNLTDVDARDRAVESLEWRLFGDVGGLINFVAGEHGHLATENMLRRAVFQRTRQDPESAVAWAEALPKDRAPDARNAVIDAWRHIDSKAFARWESKVAK